MHLASNQPPPGETGSQLIRSQVSLAELVQNLGLFEDYVCNENRHVFLAHKVAYIHALYSPDSRACAQLRPFPLFSAPHHPGSYNDYAAKYREFSEDSNGQRPEGDVSTVWAGRLSQYFKGQTYRLKQRLWLRYYVQRNRRGNCDQPT